MIKYLKLLIIYLVLIEPVYSQTIFDALASSYLKNNELNSQREKTISVDENLIQALSAFKPTITGTINQSDYLNENQTDNLGSAQVDTNYQPKTNSITIEQKLFQGIPDAMKAKKEVKIARFELKKVEQNVLYKTAEVFTDVILAQKNIVITQDNLSLSEQQVELDKGRYERGAIRLSDLAQSESSLASAKSKFIKAKNDLMISEKNFINIVGDEPKKLEFDSKLNLKLPVSLNDAIQLAERNNPELKISELNYLKSKDSLNAAIEDLGPKFSLSYKLSESRDTSLTIDERKQSLFGAEVEIPIYQGGKNYSVFRQKKSLKLSRELDYLYKKKEIKKNAANTWSGYSLKKSQLILAKAQLEAAEIAYEGIKQEYENGLRTTLDVLNSRSLLLEARQNFIKVEQEEILARFELLRITGNLTAIYLELEAKYYDPKSHPKRNWIRHIF